MDRTRLVALVLGLAAAVVVLVLLSRGAPPESTNGERDRGSRAKPAGEVAPAPAEPGTGDTVAETDGPALVVAVLGPDGLPLAGAGVILAVDGKAVARGETGADGEVRLPAPGGDGEVVVLPGRAPPRRQAASLVAGRIEVAIPPGCSIEGRVVVGDAPAVLPPGEILELTAWSRIRFEGFTEDPQPFPDETRTWQLVTRTDPDGGFAFRELPAGWTGFLVCPAGYRLVKPALPGEGDRSLTVTAPVARLLVRLRRLPVLTAKVVRADGSAAVGAPFQLNYASDRSNGTMGGMSDETGRIRIVRPDETLTSAALTVSDPAAAVSTTIELDPRRLVGDTDLGDIKLPTTRDLVLVVRTAGGVPIAGAWACTADDRTPHAGPSSASGELAMTVAATAGALRVAALGHGMAQLEIPAGEDRLVVTLGGDNTLTVRVEEPEGSPAAAVIVTAESPTPMFRGGGDGPDPLLARAGATPYALWSTGGGRDRIRLVPRDGRVVLAALTPGAVLKLRVLDSITNDVLATREIAVGLLDAREIALRIERVARTLDGRVVDPDGTPIEDAVVRCRVSGKRYLNVSTLSDGSFRLPGLRAESIDLRVSRYGHAPVEFRGVRPGEGFREVVLQPGRTVRVDVVDTAGAAVADAEVGAAAAGLSEPFDGLDEAPGTFVVKDLPTGRVTLFADFAGRRVEIEHDTAVPKARIVVPRTGSLVVRIPFALTRPVIHRIRLEPLDGRGAEVMEDVGFDGRKERTVVVPAALPGRYRVRLEAWKDDESEEDVYEPVAAGPEVVIRAGVRITAELAR